MADANEVSLDENQSLYAYAITPEPLSDELDNAVGVSETATVRSIPIGGFGVTLETVDTELWVGPEADESLRKLEWIGPRAVRHEEVVTATSVSSQTFPLPFATLFSSVDELRERLADYAPLIQGYFDDTRGCEEWAIKGIIDRDTVEEHLMGAEAGPAGGADYLQRRKQVQETRKQIEPWLNEVGAPFWELLVGMTRDHRVLSTAASRKASDEDVVFNWAFLVPTAERSRFEEAVDGFHAANVERGLGLRLSGPWAPYSFRPALPDAT